MQYINIVKNLCKSLTFCKAFDSIPDFVTLGYQVEIIDVFFKNLMFAYYYYKSIPI